MDTDEARRPQSTNRPEESAVRASDEERKRADAITLFLAGDVMTGRGIDQVLPHPGDPTLHESYLKSAQDYVVHAERTNGPIGKPLAFGDIWGDALSELERRKPAARIINLETAVTRSAEAEPKGINYKMNPANIGAIAAAGVDCCALANNHVLDWGRSGLIETLDTLENAGVSCTGAGRDLAAAAAPAVFSLAGGTRLLVYAFASPTSGVPRQWTAGPHKPGVNLLPSLSDKDADAIAGSIQTMRQQHDIVVLSIHWGGNWGYDITDGQIAFAHRLVESGAVDIVHGHSSHHAKAMEVYRRKLILYGCGDFINDYEGIRGYEAFRDDLVLMYFPAVRRADGTLAGLDMMPFQIRNMRLHRASPADADWLGRTLAREGERFRTRIRIEPGDVLRLEWD